KVEVSPPATTVATTTQLLVKTGREPHDKRDTLRRVIRSAEGLTNAIIFCNRKREVAALHRSLVRHGFSAIPLHGDMAQPARMAALDQFRRTEVTLLVASDAAARGLDIPAVSHIFNFDVPHHPDDYVHRIGRTGRAGRSGTAITIVAPADGRSVAAIEKLIGQTIPWMGKEPHASAQEHGEQEHTERDRTEREHAKTGATRTRARSKAAPNNGAPKTRTPPTAAPPEPGPGPPAGRGGPPPQGPRLAQVRPRRAGKPAHADEGAGGHLPAFLLRPVRV